MQVLPSNRADQPFHKGMGPGNVGHGLDLGYFQDSQIGLPLLKPIKGIVVGAKVLGHLALAANRVVKHPAKSDPVDASGMDAEPMMRRVY